MKKAKLYIGTSGWVRKLRREDERRLRKVRK